jgi:hypothetical protein
MLRNDCEGDGNQVGFNGREALWKKSCDLKTFKKLELVSIIILK